MSSILNDLDIDPDNFDWFDLALCRGMDFNLFFDKYEVDVNIAKSVDEACATCPVMKMCYQAGVENNEYGVWGGVYLNSGAVDNSKNTHKTKEMWKRLKK